MDGSVNMAAEEETIESLLHKATNPLNKDDDVDAVHSFAVKLNRDYDNHQNAIRLIAHKIQSPLEREALQALHVLEHCGDACDKRFHAEIGKFRFLNEMIKLVSPKYLGNRTPVEVKQRVIQIMYKWSKQLKEEPKIGEAYQMLKQQGVVTDDPVFPEEVQKYSLSPRPKNTIFDDEEKSKLLHRLLQSKNPEDLQAANRLIKNMVKEDEKRMERVSKRVTELETVSNNIKVLEDMLANYRVGVSSKEEIELMKELYQSCEQLRPNLFRLASDVEENDASIDKKTISAEILKANDELGQTMAHYRMIFGEQISENHSSRDPTLPLLDLGSPISGKGQDLRTASEISLLDDQLLGLEDRSRPSSAREGNKNELQELGDIFSSSLPAGLSSGLNSSLNNSLELLNSTLSPALPQPLQSIKTAQFNLDIANEVSKTNEQNNAVNKLGSKGLEDLDMLGQTLLKQALPPTLQPGAEFPNFTFRVPDKIPMNQLPKRTNSNPGSPALQRANFSSEALSTSSSPSKSPAHDIPSLANLFVPLDSVQPGSEPPLTLYDKNGLNVVLHFGKNVPRPDTKVLVVTTVSKNPDAIKNVLFQSAVPKTMRVKLQPPSATSLPGHNPILPPAAITQVMLLANPSKEKVRLKYKVCYTLNDEPFTDIGEIDSLPVS